jgi:hypothetical protein
MVGVNSGPIHWGARPSNGAIEVGALHGDRAADALGEGSRANTRPRSKKITTASNEAQGVPARGYSVAKYASRIEYSSALGNPPVAGKRPATCCAETPYRDDRYCGMIDRCSSLTSARMKHGMLGRRLFFRNPCKVPYCIKLTRRANPVWQVICRNQSPQTAGVSDNYLRMRPGA